MWDFRINPKHDAPTGRSVFASVLLLLLLAFTFIFFSFFILSLPEDANWLAQHVDAPDSVPTHLVPNPTTHYSFWEYLITAHTVKFFLSVFASLGVSFALAWVWEHTKSEAVLSIRHFIAFVVLVGSVVALLVVFEHQSLSHHRWLFETTLILLGVPLAIFLEIVSPGFWRKFKHTSAAGEQLLTLLSWLMGLAIAAFVVWLYYEITQ